MNDTSSGVSSNDRIIVGVDGSDHSKQALREAATLARALKVSLEAIACWQDPALYGGAYGYVPDIDPNALRAGNQKMLEDALEEVFGHDRPSNLSSRLLHGHPAEMLVEESRNARMLVIGSHGAGGILGRFLGSVSSAVVSHAHCPVLVVRGHDVTEAGHDS